MSTDDRDTDNYLAYLSEKYPESSSGGYGASALTCKSIAERLKQTLMLIARRQDDVPAFYYEQLVNFCTDFESLAKQSQVDSDAVNRLQTELYQLLDENAEVQRAHRVARKLQMLQIFASKLEWFGQLEKQKGLSPEQSSTRDRLVTEHRKLKQLLVDQQGEN